MDEQTYKLAMDRAYLDELLQLETALEKIAADEYEGPKGRHAAGVAGAMGAGAGAGGLASEIGREGTRRRLGKLEKQRKSLVKSYQGGSQMLGQPGTSAKLKKLEAAQKSNKLTQQMLRKRLGKSRAGGPVAGALALGIPAAAALGASTPKGRELISKGWEKAKKYV